MCDSNRFIKSFIRRIQITWWSRFILSSVSVYYSADSSICISSHWTHSCVKHDLFCQMLCRIRCVEFCSGSCRLVNSLTPLLRDALAMRSAEVCVCVCVCAPVQEHKNFHLPAPQNASVVIVMKGTERKSFF